ncbi:MAG: DUF3520 domain-containing protein, partial [Bacteroidia bacterium]|nr:DUF3520 domain-containing protein [Bacteroidia bacterium]
MGVVKIRYKPVSDTVSKEIAQAVNKVPNKFEKATENLRFASSVALSGMVLKNSPFLGKGKMEDVVAIATQASGTDKEGTRKEFISLMGNYK